MKPRSLRSTGAFPNSKRMQANELPKPRIGRSRPQATRRALVGRDWSIVAAAGGVVACAAAIAGRLVAGPAFQLGIPAGFACTLDRRYRPPPAMPARLCR